MSRDDLQGRRAPVWLQRVLTRRFGRTPFGEPRFRLVWAPARRERCGGVWNDWEGGRLCRRVAAYRWVAKYPGEQAWLLERWQPAASYGDPAQWYAPLEQGGTVLRTDSGPIAMLGDYPVRGDYEDIGARMYWYPSENQVVLAAAASERARESAPATPLGRARRRLWLAEQQQARQDRAFDQFASDLFDDCSPAFGGAPMLGYGGTHRPALVEMAEAAGIRQHPL